MLWQELWWWIDHWSTNNCLLECWLDRGEKASTVSEEQVVEVIKSVQVISSFLHQIEFAENSEG